MALFRIGEIKETQKKVAGRGALNKKTGNLYDYEIANGKKFITIRQFYNYSKYGKDKKASPDFEEQFLLWQFINQELKKEYTAYCYSIENIEENEVQFIAKDYKNKNLCLCSIINEDGVYTIKTYEE